MSFQRSNSGWAVSFSQRAKPFSASKVIRTSFGSR